MRYLILILFAVLLFSACQKTQIQSQNASPDAKRYALRGKVIAVDRAKKTATVAHEDVGDGFMPAMTMDFTVKDDWVWDDLTKDAEIRADLVVDRDGFWLENFAITAAPNPNQPAPPANENFAQIGKEIPDFILTNQDGKRISLKDFRGKALAITFIYTRCPLPNYCIKMSTAFSDAAKQITASDLKDKVRLLSVSFDPEYDTPKTLRDYGLGYLRGTEKPDFSVWQLATGSEKEIRDISEFFGLRFETDESDKTQINHSLRTIVVAPDGTARKILSGNEWTTNDLLRELQAVIQ